MKEKRWTDSEGRIHLERTHEETFASQKKNLKKNPVPVKDAKYWKRARAAAKDMKERRHKLPDTVAAEKKVDPLDVLEARKEIDAEPKG
jgi:hypothetical protein